MQAAFHARIAFCMDVHNEVGATTIASFGQFWRPLACDCFWPVRNAPLQQPACCLCLLPTAQPNLTARFPPHPPTPQPSLQAVKAMRYGEGGGAVQEFEDATALREKQEQELAAALEEDDDF